jgi:hypothetical protein
MGCPTITKDKLTKKKNKSKAWAPRDRFFEKSDKRDTAAVTRRMGPQKDVK